MALMRMKVAGKPSDQVIYLKEHLYVFNGMTSVGLNPKQFGVLDKITIKPLKHPMMDGLSLKGIQIRNRSFDVMVKGGKFSVISDGQTLTRTLGETVELTHDQKQPIGRFQ